MFQVRQQLVRHVPSPVRVGEVVESVHAQHGVTALDLGRDLTSPAEHDVGVDASLDDDVAAAVWVRELPLPSDNRERRV